MDGSKSDERRKNMVNLSEQGVSNDGPQSVHDHFLSNILY